MPKRYSFEPYFLANGPFRAQRQHQQYEQRPRIPQSIAVDAANRVVGREIPVEYGARRPGDAVALFADARKIQSELGWSARYTDIEEIVATAWKWFEKHPDGYDAAGVS